MFFFKTDAEIGWNQSAPSLKLKILNDNPKYINLFIYNN